jgi:hypothetical protein
MEFELLNKLKELFANEPGWDIEIVTENDAEVFVDDWIFRVHVEADING